MADQGFVDNIRLREAGPGDAEVLSSLAFRSKASWGYDVEFMKRCRDELSYSAETIESPRFRFRVAELEGQIVAFYALELLGDGQAELEALFVRPDHIGKGLGRVLIDAACSEASLLGVACVTIQGDPNADEFYLAVGAVQAGYRESASIPGRYLPVYKLHLGQGD